jgi:hypothetical protein
VIKTGKVLNLNGVNADIEDTEAFSRYFVVSDLDPILTSGKNSLSINGSQYLQKGGEIFVEVLDVNGKSLYVELASAGNQFSYREGVSIVYSIHVYENTPSGVGQIIILGTEQNGGIVKWSKSIEINPSLPNKSRVRFYNQPSIEVTPFLNSTSESTISLTVAIGNCIGTPILPRKGTYVKEFDFSRNQTEYIITRVSGDAFTSDMNGKKISLNGDDYIIQQVITDSTLKLSSPIVSETGTVIGFDGVYQIQHFPYNTTNGTINQLKKIGTAEIRFKNLNTFTGKVYRYKIYRSSINAPYDSECVADGVFDGGEVLYDSETPYRNNSYIGKIFSPFHLSSHWFTNTPDTSLRHTPELAIDSFTTSGFETDNSNKSKYIIAKVGENAGSSYIEYNSNQDSLHSGSAYNSNFMHLYAGTEYVFSCDITLTKSNTNDESKVEFYFISSMSSLKMNKNYDGVGLKISSIVCDAPIKRIKSHKVNFYVESDVAGTFVIYPSNLNLTVSNISIKPYTAFSFGPNVSVIRIPFDARAKNEGNLITCELFDINSNLINANLSTVQYFDPDGITYPYNISVTQAEIDVSLSEINAKIDSISSSLYDISSSVSTRLTVLELGGGGGGGSSSIATTSSLGIIKVGRGLKIDATGSLSVDYSAILWGG